MMRAQSLNSKRSGYAMLAVLLVLVSLLFLVAPFLATVKNADQSSRRRTDDTAAGLALDDAARLGQARLGASHPSRDRTPFFDGPDEVSVHNDIDPDFLYGAGRKDGARWDLEVEDLAGRIDLDSAPPAVIANMLGLVSHLGSALTEDATSMSVTSTAAFPPKGVLWVNGELIGYASKTQSSFTGLQRGLGAEVVDDEAVPGPLPARTAPVGAVVMDQRAWALSQWRLFDAPQGDEPAGRRSPRMLGSLDRLVQVGDFVLDGDWDIAELSPLFSHGGVWGTYGADPKWMTAVRGTSPVVSGETMSLSVAEVRWFGAGTTVRIHGNGVSEMAVVRAVDPRRGQLYFDRPLANDQDALDFVVEPLARRAVNVNTASPEVLEALFANLQLRGRNSRITKSEAKQITEVVMGMRPIKGFQDFVERVILPVGGFNDSPPGEDEINAIIDSDDALALYRNALCANDADLAFSTMPLRFTTRDVYALDLRVSVTAKSGIERLERVREEVHQVSPQGELMRLWTRQEEFDEELRLSRAAKLWNTGPNPTSRHDSYLGSSPPSRFKAHLGSDAFKAQLSSVVSETPAVEGAFADRESEGWIQPWASRANDTGVYTGHVRHFDWEPETNQGFDMGEQPLTVAVEETQVNWKGKNPNALLRPVTFSAWVRPSAEGGYLLDVAGSFKDADRISLLVEGTDLVLRVLDGAGDHPQSTFKEIAEVRHSLVEGPGLPVDTWSHVLVEVRGNRPDQMLLMVDARPATGTPGLTHLTADLNDSSGLILVESTDGFPDLCVLRIGDELIEARVKTITAFDVAHEEYGYEAGFGGRLAREPFVGTGNALVNGGLNKTTSFQEGSAVTLYGYSLPTMANASGASVELKSELGQFAVGIVVGVEGGDSPAGDSITITVGGNPNPVTLGFGIERNSPMTGIRLGAADLGRDPAEVMQAFSPDGGYALLVQLNNGLNVGGEDAALTGLGTPIFGMELVHYSGQEGGLLKIDGRGDGIQCSQVQRLAETDLLSQHAFVTEWLPQFYSTVDDAQSNLINILSFQTFVVPISIRIGNTSEGFPLPGPGLSEYVQMTRLGSAELTEWIRYDEIVGGQLIRSDFAALQELGNLLNGGSDDNRGDFPPPPDGSIAPPDPSFAVTMTPVPSPPASAPPASSALAGSYWDGALGKDENEQWPVSRAVQTNFRFRGVLGTFSHSHPAKTTILPVFRLRGGPVNGGKPGRLDNAFFLDYDTRAPAWPVVVHNAYQLGSHLTTSWSNAVDSNATPLSASGGGQAVSNLDNAQYLGQQFVAMQEALPIPIAQGIPPDDSSQLDPRSVSRMVKFPSGERPRLVDHVHLGQSMDGSQGAVGLMDEVAFLSNLFGQTAGGGEEVLGGSMVLEQPISSGDNGLVVGPHHLRWPGGDKGTVTLLLSDSGMSKDAGLLRIGNEIIAYSSLSEQIGGIQIPDGGRGMLGTKPQAHAAGEPVFPLSFFPVTQIAAPLSADDAEITLEDDSDFASSGLLRVGEELIHYTSKQGTTASMPRASEVPGARDGKGGGLFRGRFGTIPSTHMASAVVVGLPFRFWDRWSAGADAPELSYFGFEPSEADAFWRSVFWKADYEREGAYIGMLLRTNPSIPWDADPAVTEGLYLFDGGKMESGGNQLNFQSNQVEARVFVGYRPGSYDVLDGLSHGWKQGPRVRALGFEYMAPGVVLERTWK